MLELKGLDKYFFKGRKNQIHVIDDTSITMGDSGLVALLGPSGCGKTTLLNVIGGLDSADKGDVYLNGERITGRRAGKTDAIRSLGIGYIFQNYNLLENMTVYDNVAIALKMVGVKSEREIEEKVNYVLHRTGLYRYRNRLAEMLSGGERQRVGIARAIVKNPDVIIADEPTGNLDSRNTIEVMRVIKAISREKLVILVTHEEELAGFYADRIIRIGDGKVTSDEVSDSGDSLHYNLDYKVYLGDIKDHHRLKSNRYDIDFYNDSGGGIDLDIVIRNGSVLIRNNTPDVRMEIVDNDSPVELIDGQYQAITDETEADGFDIRQLEPKGKRRYKSIIGPVRMIKMGLSHIGDYGIIKKILLAGFVVSAMFVTYSVCSVAGIEHVTDDMFIVADKDYLSIESKHNDAEQYAALENFPGVDYIMPGDSQVELGMKYDAYLQTQAADISLSGSLSDYSKLSESQLLYGRLPESKNEIVVDKMTIRNAIESLMTKEVGLAKVKDYLDCSVTVPDMGDLRICGISDQGSPCIYADRSRLIDIISCSDNQYDYSGGLVNYKLHKKKLDLAEGSWPERDYEVVVSLSSKEDMKIGETIDIKAAGHKLKVSGYYKDSKGKEYLLVSPGTLKAQLVSAMPGITISPVKGARESLLSDLRSNDYNVRDVYSQSRNEYIRQNSAYTRSSLIAALIILAISCIEIYIIMRASFLSRIKEVGVLRAIGVKKGDIYRMFKGEILTITTLTSMPGFLFMFYVLHRLSGMSGFETSFLTSPLVAAVCVVIIYGTNLLFGLIPVFRTIRKRPAVLLARTDID